MVLGRAVGFLVLGMTPLFAMFMEPQPVPVERLVKSANDYLAHHPDNAEAYYTLARIHYLAFAYKSESVRVFPENQKGDLPAVMPSWMEGWMSPASPGKEIQQNSDLVHHVELAERYFERAISLDPKNGLYVLRLASLSQQVRDWSSQQPAPNLPPSVKNVSIHQLRSLYAKAFSLASDSDSKIKEKGPTGADSLVSYEAGKALIALAEEKQFVGDEERQVASAREQVSAIDKIPQGAVTPLVLSLHPGHRLSDFLDRTKIVDFDLRGYGPRERWPWVKPTLGFLVWDPTHEGQIRSARQMFGGYTFQIFRANGFDALAALDDNRDGRIDGSELKDLSVWFDRNENGRSDAGEVIPVDKLGIRSITVRAHGEEDGSPVNTRGIVLKSGRVLPLWDWTPQPVRPAQIARR